MTRLSKEIEEAAFLSWAKPISDAPGNIKRQIGHSSQAERPG